MEHSALARWQAVVLAGGKPEPELRSLLGDEAKGLAVFDGKPSVLRVAEAFLNARFARVAVVGGAAVRQSIPDDERIVFAQPGETNISSAINGMRALKNADRIVFSPSDCPLLRWEDVARFCATIEQRLVGSECQKWFAAGLTPKAAVTAEFPDVEMKYLKLERTRFASGALYAASPEAVEYAAEKLQRSGKNRKSQLKLLLQFGFSDIIKYFLGRISLDDAERIAGKFLGGCGFIAANCHPRTAMDYDTAEDYEWLQRNFVRLRFEES